MNALNAFLQFLLFLAVIFYFAGFVAPAPLKFRLWKWAALLLSLVFLIAILVVEARAHPFFAFLLLVCASLASFGIVELRRANAHRSHRPVTPPFFSLRTTGKTPADITPDHPFAETHDEADE